MPFDVHGALLVAVVAGVTALIRFLPFVVFGGGRPTPKFVVYLAGVLPCAIMAMLVVYCLRGVDLLGPTHGLPELLAGAAVVGLHLWKKNTLLSIAVGTALYMVLVQAVFVYPEKMRVPNTSRLPLRGGSARRRWGREPSGNPKHFGLWQGSLPPALRATSLAE